MKKNGLMWRLSVVGLLAGMLFLSSCQRGLTDYVNPLVGTDGHGHTFPGAILPFGMVQASPDTRLDGWDGCSGYHYSDDTIYGFSHTHLSGTGCSDYGDLLIMPFTAENGAPGDSLGYDFYLSAFSHRNEKAEPGYYRVVLDRNRVMAELTVDGRSALHKYTFPNTGRKGIVIDLKHRDVVCDASIIPASLLLNGKETQAIIGHRTSSAWNPEQHFYYAIAADCNIEEIVLYEDGKPEKEINSLYSKDCKAILYFPDKVKEVTITVGISAVDEDGAMSNLEATYGTPFSQARQKARATWEKALSVIEVEGGSQEDRSNFYTALYHCMTSPYLYSDGDGRYRTMRDTSGATHIDSLTDGTQRYTVFSVWDTYRTLHPLLNIIDPKLSRDFVLTMLDHYRNGGELTMWELSSHETHCMIGYHAASVILDAYRTGVLDNVDDSTLNALLEGMIATSNLPMLGRSEYARDNYLSSEYENESVSKTLEYAYDDWCISEFIRLTEGKRGETHPALYHDGRQWSRDDYLRRSQSWKNIMDGNGFMHARRNGAFVTPFDPTEVNNHYTEANCWQYSSYVPHDVEGWIAMLGGEQKAERFLDSLFHGSSKMTGREQSDITGVIGQYAHGNEPSHHAAYLYAYIGKQYKTAELVRRICKELYHNTPDGLCGNEDCGQMSAWYVMSAMGLYPVCPGSGQYVVGSPLFKKTTIHLQNGKDIVINSKGNGCYVSKLKVDGTDNNKSFITFEQLKEGCMIDFEMSESPNEQWGSAPESRPKSCVTTQDSLTTITLAPVFDDWQQSFSGEATVAISSPSGDSIYYTLDGTEPGRHSMLYSGPVSVAGDVEIKAVAFGKGGRSAVVTHKMTHTQSDRRLTYITRPAPQYSENGETGLIDRLHGTENYRIGGWQGWQGDCEVVVDLLEPRTVSQVGVECLENMKSWVFFPARVNVEVSDDGSSYRPFGSIDNTMFAATADRQELSTMHTFAVRGTPQTVRYVRIKAINYGKLPAWHISAGNQAWLFVDEIEVN